MDFGIQTFFFDGRKFTLAEVFVGYNEAETGRMWCNSSVLLGCTDDGFYRIVELPEGKFKATWDDHFKAWIADYSQPA